MNFFIASFRDHLLESMFKKNINKIIKPIAFIGGNLLWSYLMKRLNKYLKPIKVSIDTTKLYIDNSKEKFIETFDKVTNEDININIEKEFYLKDDYTNIMKQADNHLEKGWKTKVLIENTPKGNIIMFYDSYKQGFSYYTDINPLPYNILNSVAMKYVTIYKCRDFFVDDEITPENKESPFIEIHMVDKPKKKGEDSNKLNLKDAPFARLKNYKSKKVETKDKDGNDKKPERVYYRNKFICMGTIRNYSITQKIKKENKLNGFHSNLLNNISSEAKLQKEVMNYKDFKLKRG